MQENIYSLKKTARLAGILYFFLAVRGIYNLMYVTPHIKITGDTAATGKIMLANEFLFRTSIASGVISNILFLAVVLLLYQVFKKVNKFQARLMAGLIIVVIPVSFIGESLQLIALQIFKGNLLRSFAPPAAQDIAATLLKIGDYITQLITFHWGLWLIPLGLLVYRSGFIPRILGVLLMINGVGYIVSSGTFILFPNLLPSVSKFIYPTYFMGELPFIFWLMIKGVKTTQDI